MDPSAIPPSAPAPLPARTSRATLANVIGWPAVTLLTAGHVILSPSIAAPAARAAMRPPA